MSLYSLLKEIKPVEDTSIKVYKMIQSQGILTGSCLWEVNTKDSDIDIILPPHPYIDWGHVVQQYNGIYLHADEEHGIIHYSQDDFQSCYVYFEYNIYNLLFMRTQEAYDKWIYATDKFSSLIQDDEIFKEKIKNKEYRIEEFERLKRRFEMRNKI